MKIKSYFLMVLGLAALGLFPVLVPNPYYVHLVETILIYAILLFGLDIVVATPARCRSDTRVCLAWAPTPLVCCSSSWGCLFYWRCPPPLASPPCLVRCWRCRPCA